MGTGHGTLLDNRVVAAPAAVPAERGDRPRYTRREQVVESESGCAFRLPYPFVIQYGGVSMATGTVKWFDDAKGYGFITPDDGSKDLFVHHSSIAGSGLQVAERGREGRVRSPRRRKRPAGRQRRRNTLVAGRSRFTPPGPSAGRCRSLLVHSYGLFLCSASRRERRSALAGPNSGKPAERAVPIERDR